MEWYVMPFTVRQPAILYNSTCLCSWAYKIILRGSKTEDIKKGVKEPKMVLIFYPELMTSSVCYWPKQHSQTNSTESSLPFLDTRVYSVHMLTGTFSPIWDLIATFSITSYSLRTSIIVELVSKWVKSGESLCPPVHRMPCYQVCHPETHSGHPPPLSNACDHSLSLQIQGQRSGLRETFRWRDPGFSSCWALRSSL